MRATIVFIHPLHTFAPLADKEINERSCLETIDIIRTYIVVVSILAIVILLHSNHKVSIERLQYMLIRTSRIRIANNNILMFCSRTNTIRNDAVCGEVAATNHVTCTSSRDRDNWQSVLIGEERALVGMGNKL